MALRQTSFAAVLMVVLGVLLAGPVRAVEPDEILPDAKLEARARALSAELRCLVCQNQSIDDSNAPLARDLRLLVRERLKTGESDDAVMKFIVARYGDFVLLKPPMNAATLLLWLGPPAMLLLTLSFLLVKTRRERLSREAAQETVAPLSEAEKARLDQMLKGDSKA